MRTHAKEIIKLLTERPKITDADGYADWEGDELIMIEIVNKYLTKNFGWQTGEPPKEGRLIAMINYYGVFVIQYNPKINLYKIGLSGFDNVTASQIIAWMPIPQYHPQGGGEI